MTGGADPAARTSAYARYLPPVLLADGPGFSVGSLLLLAEKILGGLDDGVPVVHAPPGGQPHTHEGVQTLLDRLHLILDPARTPRRYLPMLEAWLGVDPPRSWTEFQRRRAVAGRVEALGASGTHDGLRALVAPFEAGASRPRITFDDGARLLFTTPALAGRGGPAPVYTLVGDGPFLRSRTTAAYPGLVDPACLARTPAGDLLVGDVGNAAVPPGMWLVSRSGDHLRTAGAPPVPRPLGPTGAAAPNLGRPRAVAVEGAAASWIAWVLDDQALWRLDPTVGNERLASVATRAQLDLTAGAAQLVSDGPGRLLVLDGNAVVVVDATATPRPTAERHPLGTADLVPGPLAAHNGQLLVADPRTPLPSTATDSRPADLVLVTRTGTTWTGRRLLAGLPAGANPLITPVALVSETESSLLVLDTGLRQTADAADPSYPARAEHAAVYRLRLDNPTDPARFAVTAVERVTETGRMVAPNGMVLVEGTVYVSDPGQPVGADENPQVRNMPGHVAVQVHFSRERPADVPTRRTTAGDVYALATGNLPAAVVAARPTVPTDPEERRDG